MSKTQLTVKQITDLNLWDKVCDYKGWNPWIKNEGQIDNDEVVEFDSEFKKEITTKYPEYIMQQVRQNLDIENDDPIQDQEINSMSKEEVFERICTWNGLLGYADTIKNWIEDIYGIEIN